ncbi:MAG: MATE family efflux transporter [Bacteroidetes bacterium]|nr:MATE family efflux transporter [Bacteroidota bacterium]
MHSPSTDSLQVSNSYRQIWKMALPISFAIFIPQINFFINTIFLGHYSQDPLAIAAGGITGVYYLIFAAIGYGLNNGLQTLIARRAGQDQPHEIGKLFTQAIWIGIGLSVLGITLTYTVTPTIFRSLLNDPVLCEKSIHFLQIRIWGLPLLYIYQLRNALLVGINQSRWLAIGTLAEAGTNVIFDYLLIFGMGGFPEWGFNGAAVASILAEGMGLITIYAVISNRGISRQFQLFRERKLNRTYVGHILEVSAPLMFQTAISIISWQYFFLLIEHHGNTALAVSNVMRHLFGLPGCLTWAFATTTSTMVSNLIGQGRSEEVPLLIRRILTLSVSMILIVCLLLNIWPELFLLPFGQTKAFVAEAIPVMRVVTGAMVLMSFGTVFLNSVTGSGNTRVTFLIEAGAILGYCTYVYLSAEYFNLSISIIWMSEWLYWLSMFLPAMWYMRSGRWRNKEI